MAIPLPVRKSKNLPLISQALYKLYEPHKSSQRFGQWFYNTYDDDYTPFPDLFYCNDYHVCLDLIYKHYYGV